MSRNEPSNRNGRNRAPDRSGSDSRPDPRRGRRSITSVPAGDLPRWVRDEVIRSTAKDRREASLRHLEKGVSQFAEERYRPAIESLTAAKALSPRAATIRELLGLAAYYSERWDQALAELRAFRRLSGETIHMPVEMDSLRALGRHADVEKAWHLFNELGGDRDSEREAAVVYASHLLDRGKVSEAWRIIKPGRLISPAPPSELRRWFVAARVALAARDEKAARQLVDAIAKQDPSMPGLEELRAAI
jgi:uncharacterized protein HemY